MDFLKEVDKYITEFMNNVGFFAPLVASILMFLESIIPILPLAVFITVNFYYFGAFWGFIISWAVTCLGCYISFRICRSKLKGWVDNKIITKNELKLTKWMIIVNHLSLEKLVLLITLPFTPAFLINIVAGVSSMKAQKFITALLIGKIFLIYFWGFVGTSLLDSFKNPAHLIIIGVMMITAFIISKVIHKTYEID